MPVVFASPGCESGGGGADAAREALRHMGNYGDAIEVWATDVADVGVAEHRNGEDGVQEVRCCVALSALSVERRGRGKLQVKWNT